MERNLNIRVPAQLYEDFDRACAYNYTNKSAVVKQFMVEYVRQNQKEEKDVTKADWIEVMNRARELAYSGTFTDEPKEADGTTYLVDDMELVVRAFAKDIEEGKLGTYDEPEKFLDAHGIKWE